ncbi:hypothetical protein [Gelidibacter sp.]|uniref:hypothetical protein n=1 Tax=Gelidibacter sp. TaxID=2018083 RepID=UPI002B563245|nr:hypothetical protein [Gelidibacter sp.]HUH26618.1 hypothetical protein [Gelidibacter sp.]
MTDKKKKTEFDPEKDKSVDKGVFKKKNTNQYGGNPGGKDRDLAGRATAERNEKLKK